MHQIRSAILSLAWWEFYDAWEELLQMSDKSNEFVSERKSLNYN